MNDRIVIIEPGSQTLRIGLCTSNAPISVHHAIGRKRSSNTVYRRVDSFLPPQHRLSREQTVKIEKTRARLRRLITAPDGTGVCSALERSVVEFNRTAEPQRCDSDEVSRDWTPELADPIVGDDVLTLNPSGLYNVYYPMRGNRLNVNSDVNGSVAAIIADLRDIWRVTMESRLAIDRRDFPAYKALLIVPCLFDTDHLCVFLTVLMGELGFGGFLLVQNHVAASIGPGSNPVCVVDIGAHGVTVSCVSDCVSLVNTRIRLPFGGAHLTRLFIWLLFRERFPYRVCAPSEYATDALLMEQLKFRLGHARGDQCRVQTARFVAGRPHSTPLGYQMRVHRSAVEVGLALFEPSILQCLCAPMIGSVIGLDEAVCDSLCRFSDDASVRRSMCASILVVGGGGLLAGLTETLCDRVGRRLGSGSLTSRTIGSLTSRASGSLISGSRGSLTSRASDQCDIRSWRGARLMSMLQTTEELWIDDDEWSRGGIGAFLDKSIFIP